MAYIALIVAVIWGILILLKLYSKADPVLIKKIYKAVNLVIGVYFVYLLLRAGLPYIAAMLGGAMALAPHFRKIIGLLYTFKMVKGLFKETKTGTPSPDNKNIKMTKRQACEILGVEENASKKEIEDAYKRLMKKNHPDTGGSKYFATELNKAKEVLLKDK
ncbi:MAG: DnaJ domain-containing protein [Rickettsiales bacterium]|nr:DnaJ domain-containing protein [Pseudomonadota bacterium]MDA0965786.1 DnaJ domain-containing protein [Pseudomonadota bacterium]MDG4543752.1 DnaJ domain-containing protein [Rickettsiales bacterium]MDG4545899.1 DnaJ domain-containing protein [Rickettsiales bacterium]MDG4548145.1 DnaJ domain-containing protein [Rickettsiales bacterium]